MRRGTNLLDDEEKKFNSDRLQQLLLGQTGGTSMTPYAASSVNNLAGFYEFPLAAQLQANLIGQSFNQQLLQSNQTVNVSNLQNALNLTHPSGLALFRQNKLLAASSPIELLVAQAQASLLLRQQLAANQIPGLNLPLSLQAGLHDVNPSSPCVLPVDSKARSNNATAENEKGKRDPSQSFPSRLHRILSTPEYQEYVTWFPNGRAWKILDKYQFEKRVIPQHFRHTRYASFMRQVNGWGFKRLTEGPYHNSYYHEYFVRDCPELCWRMLRPLEMKSIKKSTSQQGEDEEKDEHAPDEILGGEFDESVPAEQGDN